MTTFNYLAYGLSISSALECPELLPGSGAPDVYVRYGRVPAQLEKPAGQGVLYQVAPDQFLLNLEQVARFLVTNGSDIAIERAPQAADSDVRVFLLGSVLGALLHQRGILPLHASAIETPHGAVAFAGHVGAGKSTLAAAFHSRGYRVVADDVCAVSLDSGGRPVVTPAYPQLNLWADALDKVGTPKENLRRTRMQTEKYGLPVPTHFSSKSIPLYAVHELRRTNRTELNLTPVTGLDKVELIKENTFRLRIRNGMSDRSRYMALASAAARHIHAARIVRPDGAFLLDELADLVQEDWAKRQISP